MLESATNAAPFYPPRVKPSAEPLRFPFNLAKLLNNNLEIDPRAGLSGAARHRPGTAAHGVLHRPDAGEDLAARPSDGIPQRRAAGRGSQADVRQCDDLGRGARVAMAARRGRAIVPSRRASALRADHERRGGSHRGEMAGRRAGHGPCRAPGHAARRLSCHLEDDAGRRRRQDMLAAIETGASRLLRRRQLVGDVHAVGTSPLAAAARRQGDAGA